MTAESEPNLSLSALIRIIKPLLLCAHSAVRNVESREPSRGAAITARVLRFLAQCPAEEVKSRMGAVVAVLAAPSENPASPQLQEEWSSLCRDLAEAVLKPPAWCEWVRVGIEGAVTGFESLGLEEHP